MGNVQIWTQTIDTETFTITSAFGFTTISILAYDDVVTISGNKTANGYASESITLDVGQSITINSGNSETNVIDNLVITASSQAMLTAR